LTKSKQSPSDLLYEVKKQVEGASNFRAWKTRIDLILAKNKVLDIVKGKIMEPQFGAGKEKEPHNIAVMEKFKDTPDGVTRSSRDTGGLALGPGINVDGRHPRVCINDGGRP
jgi:hypothetical protein